MKKQILIFILMMVFVVSCLTFAGCEKASEGLVYGLTSDRTAYAVAGIGTCVDYHILLPSRHMGKPVTGIGKEAFKNCNKITGVTIPNSVTSIGEGAFYGCTDLASITIPSSVANIGDSAFNDCTSLKNVIFEKGSQLTNIGDSAFDDCTSIENISIPSGVTSLGDFAFDGCTSLKSITIPSSVTSLGIFVFDSCPIEKATIPAFVCSVIKSSKLKEVVIISGDTIAEGAFKNCTSLTKVVLFDCVTSIDKWAFHGCSRLTSIIIPSSVTSIGAYAFNGCDALTNVTFADPNGWVCSIIKGSTNTISLTLFNTPQNATYLKDTYHAYWWYKTN